MNKKKMMMFEIMSGNSGGGGADVSGVTATAPDVDEGKIFVDNTGSQVVGTSTYKADYIALRTDIDNLNDTLEPVLLGDGSDTNVYANVSNVTATASDVATGKVFVDNTGEEVTGTAVDSTADLIKMVDRTNNATITIPSGATQIAQFAFYYYLNLSKVNIPNTVTSIGKEAFSNCQNLSEITLPDSVITIGDNAFDTCKIATSLSLSNSLTTIGQFAFSGCQRLSQLSLPSSITNIAYRAFYGCIRVTQVTFLGTPTTIGNDAFGYCSTLTTINVPWSEGAVAGAPWGATNATIVYDYTPS